MKRLLVSLAALSLAASVAATGALAAGAGNVDDDARFAEGNPPVVPHPFADGAGAKECLSCHWPGAKTESGAPLCPHPLRGACTQCHVRSVGDDASREGGRKGRR